MRMHQVEVDDQVFAYVKGHAEPLVDNFNSTLRRLLPLGSPNWQKRAKNNLAASTKNGSTPTLVALPQALRHILEVTELVRGGGYTRAAATQFVAKQHGVFPQTVLDKYSRQLGLTAKKFDRLLEQEDLADLRKTLRSKFPSYTEVIDEHLNLGDGGV